MAMMVSLNEIQRQGEKAACGAGVPAGADADAGAAVSWLEGRSLPGLAALARDLPLVDGKAETATLTLAKDAMDRRSGDLAGDSLILCAGALIDLAVAEACRSPGRAAQIEIVNGRAPIFLLPLAAARTAQGFAFDVSWRAAEGAEPIVVLADAASGLRIYGRSEAALDRGEPADVSITCKIAEALDREGAAHPTLHTQLELERRHADAVSSGVAVDAEVWAVLSRFAKRTLVPATAESRERGAGASASDNE
jgi:hypothetical protein